MSVRIEHRWIDGEEVKRCCACKQWLPLAVFHAERRAWDLLRRSCSTCVSSKDRRYREANREKERARSRRYYEANRDKVSKGNRRYREANPEKERERKRRYYEANCEKERESAHQHREANIERARETSRRWHEANPEKVRAIWRKRRARKANADGADYTTAEHTAARSEVWGNRCYLCGAPKEAIDHVIPLAKGGSHWPANLRPICQPCNSKKHAIWPYDIEQHRREAGYYD